MKTIRGKVSYQADLSKLKEEAYKKFTESFDFFFNTEEDIKVGDVIKIHRMARFGYLHVEAVYDTVYYYSHKKESVLRVDVSDKERKDYWELKLLTFCEPELIHGHPVNLEDYDKK